MRRSPSPRQVFKNGLGLGRRQAGMTWVEVLVALVFLIILFVVVAVIWAATLRSGDGVSQPLSYAKQLSLATQCMTMDYERTKGDLRWTCSNNVPLSYAQWSNALVSGDYLSAKDFEKLTTLGSVDGFWGRKITTNAFTVFAVTDDDPADTLFLATKNWPGPGATSLSSPPYGHKGFAVFRKGGDGAILMERQIAQTNLIGSGGRFHFLPLR